MFSQSWMDPDTPACSAGGLNSSSHEALGFEDLGD